MPAGLPALSTQDMVAGVHVQRIAGDGPRAVAGQEGAQRADLLQLHQAAQRRTPHGVRHERVEVRNAGGRPRGQRPGGDRIDADPLRPQLRGQVARTGFQRRLGPITP